VVPGQKVRALTFNSRWREIAALTLNGYIHVFGAETFRQQLSRKLPSCQDLVCLATQVLSTILTLPSLLNNKGYPFGTPMPIIIINLLMSLLLGHRPSLWITHKENGP
jgi:hypothetical protein